MTEPQEEAPLNVAMQANGSDEESDQNEEFSDSVSFATEFHFTPLDPIALLMDELKHDETGIRVNAVSHLCQIAETLGPERTRSELIPFLQAACDNEDDEVLLAMTGQLAKIVPCIGGPSYAYLLVELLGKLAGQEDLDLRNAAVESIVALNGLLMEDSFRSAMFQLICSLGKHHWFTRMQSAIVLGTRLFVNFSPEEQLQILQLILAMLNVDWSVVRKCVAEHLPLIIRYLKNDKTDWEDLLRAVTKITQDDMDNVRLFGIHSIAVMADKPTLRTSLVPLLIGLLNDENWRIKYVICEKFPDLYDYFGQEPFDSMDYVNYFVKYCSDPEMEVRTSAVIRMPLVIERIIQTSGQDSVPLISPIVLLFSTSLSTDPSVRVRVEFARVISEICRLIGIELVEKFDLLSIYQQLLGDVSEVRLVLLQNLASLHQSIGIAKISTLIVDALGTLSGDTQWRVRMSLVQFLPSIAEFMGMAFFDESLSQLLLKALGDHVWSVREAALNSFTRLVTSFGSYWATSALQMYLKFLAAHQNYLFRGTALAAIEQVAPQIEQSIVSSSVVPVIIKLMDDPVPNVRLSACRCLGNIWETIRKCEGNSEAVDKLQRLSTADIDVDVKFFALDSISKMK